MPRNRNKPGGSRGARRQTAAPSVESGDTVPALPSIFGRNPARGRPADGLAFLFDNAPIGYVALDSEDTILSANRALADLLNVPQPRLCCREFSSFVAADSLGEFREFRRRVKAAGSVHPTELNLCRAAGDPFPARLQHIAAEDAHELLSVTDLSEVDQARTRLEEREVELRVARRQLERSGRREQDYLQIADVIMVALNSAGEIKLLNRRGCELLGYEEHEVRHRSWFELFPPEDEKTERREAFEQAVSDNVPLPEFVNNTVVTRQGQVRHIRWHNMTLRDVHGRIEGALASGVDITDQLRTEQRLQRSQAALVNTRQKLDLYESIMVAVVENAADAVLTIGPEGLIQTANRAALRMFGYKEHELVGRHLSILVPPPDHQYHDDDLASAIRGGIDALVGEGREVTASRRDGECFPVHLFVADIGDHAMRVYTGVLRDLTREKQLQKKLQDQEALATLGRMAAVVAHEVRNPLAGISGVIQIFRDKLAKDSAEYAVLGDVLTRIDALVETIQDLLLYARPRALRLQPVRLSDLLAQSVRLVEEDPRFRAVEITVASSETSLQLDADYFREVLLNLLINAAQAMNGAGKIRCTVEEGGGHVHLRIADNGPGIHPDTIPKVFDAFFTTKGRGTGLGLAFVKNVVERHGGHASIDCPVCGGTVVSLILPADSRVARGN